MKDEPVHPSIASDERANGTAAGGRQRLALPCNGPCCECRREEWRGEHEGPKWEKRGEATGRTTRDDKPSNSQPSSHDKRAEERSGSGGSTVRRGCSHVQSSLFQHSALIQAFEHRQAVKAN